jgi:uncharacterized membrane protein YdbT with pleckstrin-like domain
MAYLDALLAPGEVVVVRERQHWIALLRRIAGAALLAILAIAMTTLYGLGGWPTSGVGAWVGAGLLVLAFLLALPATMRWWNEQYLVTDRRVLRVEGVFRKQALDSGLAKINDVHVEQSFLGRLLGFGSLEILTASDATINRLDLLPRPLAFKRALMTAAHQGATARAAGGAPAAASPSRPAADRLAELDEMRRRGLISDAEYEAKRAEILSAL